MRNWFLLLMIFCAYSIHAQRQVTNLHYVWTENFKSPKKTDSKEKFQFNFSWDPATQIYIGEKTKTDDKNKPKAYPRHIIDLQRRIIVVQMEKRNEYLLEELDSFFYPKNLKLSPLEEEPRDINGFKCKGYSLQLEVGIKTPVGPFAGIQETYTVWITEDLKFNNELNPALFSLLKTQSAQGADFTGVIVQFDYKMAYGDRTWNNVIALDVTKLDQKPETLKWPWESSDGVAWLELTQLNDGTSIVLYPGWKKNGAIGGVYREGDVSVTLMNKRLKMLLTEITGQQNPKTKLQYFQNIFGVGAWGN
jgi:hypothetical protein